MDRFAKEVEVDCARENSGSCIHRATEQSEPPAVEVRRGASDERDASQTRVAVQT